MISLWMRVNFNLYFEVFEDKAKKMFREPFLLSEYLVEKCKKWDEKREFGFHSYGLSKNEKKNIKAVLGWKKEFRIKEALKKSY